MTTSEENYLKVIYHLSNLSPKGVNTNAIAAMLDTKASSVTDMLKKLSEKEWVNYSVEELLTMVLLIIGYQVHYISFNLKQKKLIKELKTL